MFRLKVTVNMSQIVVSNNEQQFMQRGREALLHTHTSVVKCQLVGDTSVVKVPLHMIAYNNFYQ